MDAQIVKLRFFSGLGNEDIATLLEVSERTVERHWKLAKLWLYRELKESNGDDGEISIACVGFPQAATHVLIYL
jgi:DNA-directed RNA polymerase specialized sigma24 family protein